VFATLTETLWIDPLFVTDVPLLLLWLLAKAPAAAPKTKAAVAPVITNFLKFIYFSPPSI
jgi:hypothetical protein